MGVFGDGFLWAVSGMAFSINSVHVLVLRLEQSVNIMIALYFSLSYFIY
jgi:hypothetical protein